MDREAWHAVVMKLQRARHDWATELKWTEYLDAYAALWCVNDCFKIIIKPVN